MSKFHTLTIKEFTKETKNAVSIAFEIPATLQREFQFKAGQYINIKKTIAGEELRRAYSICSEPKSGELRVAIKAVDNGTFSVFANTILKEGDTLEVQKPEGKFILETAASNSKNYLGIAAGSGITPVIAMIKAVLTNEPHSTFTLIYGNKTVDETIFKTEIDSLITKFPTKFKVQYVLSRERQENALLGRIDTGTINYVVKNNFEKSNFDNAFLCGPEEMIQTAKATLLENDFNESSILFELFSTPIKAETESRQTHKGMCEISVIVDDEETTFEMDSNVTILTAALKKGIDAPFSCQGGICTSCMAKVTKGKAIMENNSVLTDDEIEDGIVLTCQAHPTTPTIVVDYDEV